MGGEQNNNDCDVLCRTQYYYRENGSREKILNYHYARDCKANAYNIITSEGLHGVQKYFHDNNTISSNEIYFFGSKHGWQFIYNKDGKMTEKQIFYNGKLSNAFTF
jgi:antitoxin component YwqK of YwqJK toxin-antitoxin module